MTSSALLHLIKVCVHLHSIYYFSSSSDPFSGQFYFTTPFSSEGFSEIIKLEDMYEEEKYHYCLSTGEAWWKKQPEKNGEIPVLFAIWKNKEAAPAPGIISSSVNHKYSKQSPSTGICTWPRTVRHLPERLNTRDLSQYTHTYKDNIMLLHYCTSTVLHKRTCSLVIRFWCSRVQFVIWYNLLWYHKAFSVVLHRAAGIPNALSYVLQPQKVTDKSTIDDFCQLSPSISTKFHFLSMCCHMMWMAVCSHILTSNCQVSDALNDKFSSICAITKYLCTNTVIFIYKHCVQNPEVWMYLLDKNTCNNQPIPKLFQKH